MLLGRDLAALHHAEEVVFDRYLQSASQFGAVSFARDERPFRQTSAQRASDRCACRSFDELPAVNKIATQHDVRNAKAADYVPDADAEMCTDAIECHLCAAFTRIRASD